MTKLQEYAAQLKEAVDDIPSGSRPGMLDPLTLIHESIEYDVTGMRVLLAANPHFRESGGKIIRAIVTLRNLVPQLLEAVEGEGWIPVTPETMPEVGVSVLVGYESGPLAGTVREGVYFNDTLGAWNVFTPSHWQPLPKPPEITSSSEETKCQHAEVWPDGICTRCGVLATMFPGKVEAYHKMVPRPTPLPDSSAPGSSQPVEGPEIDFEVEARDFKAHAIGTSTADGKSEFVLDSAADWLRTFVERIGSKR